MKATGLIRQMDNLGRVVIPKEIRSILELQDGSLLEICYDENGVYLKKHESSKEEKGGEVVEK